MYPGSIFNLIDRSAISASSDNNDLIYRPLFLSVGSFDKGKEGFNRVVGNKFYQTYGQKMYFSKHGQNAIQTARLIDAGAEVLVYRVVAQDSALANVIFIANVTTSETQKVDDEGHPIYLDDNGNETTTVTDNPVMITNATVKWTAESFSNCKTYAEVEAKALELFDEENGVFPLIINADTGRGVSHKAFKLTPDYATSRGMGRMYYTATMFEGTAELEKTTVAFDPTVTYSNNAYGIDESSMEQLRCGQIQEVYDAYLNKLADALAIDADILRNNDLVFGYTYKGAALDNFILDAEGVDLNSDYGTLLAGGDDGAFGEAPIKDNYNALMEEIRKVYDGEVSDTIYDVDQYQIVAVLDANFSDTVKESIAQLASFRKDFMFFRDMGLGNDTYISIAEKMSTVITRDRYTSIISTSYQVKDPTTLKNIEVTANYDLADCLVAHFANGAFNPIAGIVNSFVLDNAIEGTINFTPLVTPKVNQKQAMDDLRVNYAIFQGNQCVVQSQYTAQEENTELSYTNNVIAVQEVIRAIRSECPKHRFKTIDGYDMTEYAKQVNAVLNNFAGKFYEIEFNYTADKLRAAQKIFYATISVKFNQWEQTEIFDIYALSITD